MNIIQKNIKAITNLSKKHKVKELYAFGSVTDINKFNNKSDIDLLVEFKKIPILKYADNYFEFADNLEKIFKRKVDLMTINSLHNPFFIQSVNESKKVIYAT